MKEGDGDDNAEQGASASEAPMAQGRPPQAGDVLGDRFRLTRELGRGGMGTVWAATHVVTGRAFALKLLNERRAYDAGASARLLREARASCAAAHPTILPVDDVLTLSDGRHALVMELLEGESLRARLDREGVLPLEEVSVIVRSVTDGLAAAHAAGIVHRDLKPDNIFLVAGEPPVRILDFGIAKLVTDEGLALTSTGAMLGTPYYMSPEQAFGEGTNGSASDVWSLGVVLFECLTGRRPTQAANLGQVLKLMSEERLPKLADAHLPISPRLAQVVDQMLSRAPEARPTLREVNDALLEPAPAFEPQAAASPFRKRAGIAVGIGLLLGGAATLALYGRPQPLVTAAPTRSSSAPPTGVGSSALPRTSLPEAPSSDTIRPATATVARPAPSSPREAVTAGTGRALVPSSLPTASAPRHSPTIVEEPPY